MERHVRTRVMPALRQPREGQALIIFAMLMAFVFLGVSAAAVDLANMYAERRMLQNTADAAALAGAETYAQTQDAAAARASAIDYITRNDPTNTAVYDPQIGTGVDLTEGIEVNTSDFSVRVALRRTVQGMFSQAIGKPTLLVAARSRAVLRKTSNVLPVAVKRFDAGRTDVPLVSPETRTDYVCEKASNHSTIGSWPSPTSANCSTPPSETSPGPVAAILGPEVGPNDPTTDASFAGWVSPDIRDLNTGSATFYHGVDGTTSVNQLKNLTESYINDFGGYPFDDSTPPPTVNQSIATFSGASVGLVVDAVTAKYRPGDLVVGMVYDGTIFKKPDYSISSASREAAISPGPAPWESPDNLYSFQLVSQNNFSSAGMSFKVEGLSPDYSWQISATNGYTTSTGGWDTATTISVSGTNTKTSPATGTVKIRVNTDKPTGDIQRFYVVANDPVSGLSRRYGFYLRVGTGADSSGYVTIVDIPTATISAGTDTATWDVLVLAVGPYAGPADYEFNGAAGSTTLSGKGIATATLTAAGLASTAPGTYAYSLYTPGSAAPKLTDSLTLRVIPADGGEKAAEVNDFVYVLGYSMFRITDKPPGGKSNTVYAEAVSPLEPDPLKFSKLRSAALGPWAP